MHKPVMVSEVIKFLDINPNGIYIDSTFGLGGHSRELIKFLNKNGCLIILDKDYFFYSVAKKMFKSDFRVVASCISFESYFKIIRNLKISNIDGVVTDLGLSLNQFRDISKGFGFCNNSFLDMRLNITNTFRVIDWINVASLEELEEVFFFFGEKGLAKCVASKIYFYRFKKFIKTTQELYNLFSNFKKINRSYFSKIFQSLRLFINNDLRLLKFFLNDVFYSLKPGGFLVILSFNSLEDKIIKYFFSSSNLNVEHIILSPSVHEINNNYASRSVIMRILRKNSL